MTTLRSLTCPSCCLALVLACGDDGTGTGTATTTLSTLPGSSSGETPTSGGPPGSSSTTDSGATVGTMTQGTTDSPTTLVPETTSTSATTTAVSASETADPGTTTLAGTTTVGGTTGSTTTDGTTGDDTTGGPPPFVGIPETCAEAELSQSTVGCLFYAIDMDSHDFAEVGQYAVAVANVQLDKAANITIERKQGNVWNVVAGPANIAALSLGTYNLPDNHTDDSMLKAGLAYRVKSDVPVIAYQFNPIDGQNSYLSDAAMLYPVTAWDYINHAITFTGTSDGNDFQRAYATAVAWKDGTKIKVTPSVATAAGQGVPAGQANVPFEVVLNEGDGLSVAIQSQMSALTGTIFESDEDHPFGLFAGHECALIPANVFACDHMEEQISGVRLWGLNFVASRMPVRNPNSPETSLWQLYGSEDGTTVNLTADPQVTGLPANPILLNKGQVVQFYAGGTVAEPGDFEIASDKPIAVMNYMTGSQNMPAPFDSTGDPASVQLPPFEQFLPRYVVLVPGTWNVDVGVIVRQAGATVILDGVAVADNSFNPVGNSGFEVARVPLADGVHVLDGMGDPFSIIVVGYDQYDSYAYLGGTGTAIINPDPQ